MEGGSDGSGEAGGTQVKRDVQMGGSRALCVCPTALPHPPPTFIPVVSPSLNAIPYQLPSAFFLTAKDGDTLYERGLF